MTDAFISYSHADQGRIAPLIRELEANGLSVWWDHTIPPGKSWEEVIARHITEAKACVVIWSRHSVASDWVKEEATLAKEAGKYLPVVIDDSQPPVGFRRIQAAQLANWRGDTADPQWRLLVQELLRMTQGGASLSATPLPGTRERPPAAPEPRPQPLSQNRMALVAGVLALLLVVGGATWALTSMQPEPPAVAELSTPQLDLASSEPSELASAASDASPTTEERIAEMLDSGGRLPPDASLTDLAARSDHTYMIMTRDGSHMLAGTLVRPTSKPSPDKGCVNVQFVYANYTDKGGGMSEAYWFTDEVTACVQGANLYYLGDAWDPSWEDLTERWPQSTQYAVFRCRRETSSCQPA